ncbi:MAG: RNA polymerase sigma factor [Betaproteobacteria bacterium HGW-Betaproteobacteria-22]|nr:MAG: RNA polymerase sigma factor [Betaproteobacteria bacterium HGW-Betaproteobacteria-22]
MATPKELSDFLAEVERRAFKQTVYAVRDEHAALDIVQDAMMKLAEKYGQQPVAEFPMLFQRILQNTMRDFWRRQKVRNLWTTLFSSFSHHEDGEERDPLETIDVEDDGNEPSAQLERGQTIRLIERALEKLPTRQREAFVLRYWEEMDVAETAEIMGCSDGSVKTHCSRAVHALSIELQRQGLGNIGLSESVLGNKGSKKRSEQ